MSNALRDIPELVVLDAPKDRIRIPTDIDVPITSRIRRVIDTSEFRRLAHISQLGLVSLVYPAAHHRRFEHSLGVYRLTLLFLRQLANDPRFQQLVDPASAEKLIAAALLHDIGHWPFCHPIEDLGLRDVPTHESFARQMIHAEGIAQALRDGWGIGPDDISDLLAHPSQRASDRLTQSILSGPIDADKMDYLMRDSLHAGVPYGRNFDQTRLISSLCVNQQGNGLAISEKGRTAAEMMVFARYVMFSEVYWHHAVRSATAMLQRAFFLIRDRLDLDHLFRLTELPFIEHMREVAGRGPAQPLLDGLFGSSRHLFKRWVEYSYAEHPAIYGQLARQDYAHLVNCSQEIARRLERALGRSVAPNQVLIDAPPVKLEVQFAVDIYDSKQDRYRPLVELSPVVKTLAETQFDDHVKRVRVFLDPELIEAARALDNSAELIHPS